MGGRTLAYGELMALRQEDVKRMLAYSTLGQLGEVTLVLGLGTYLATVGALAHVVNHAIMKDLLFLGAGALILRVGSRKLADLAGLGREMPWTVSCIVVGLIAIMGLPPFGGFMSKYLMIQACVSSGHAEMAALILLGSMVGLV
jgi:formate hydrogenlyase subunit 3/multisubunit Na+/H+ antiporter MnhD subunit